MSRYIALLLPPVIAIVLVGPGCTKSKPTAAPPTESATDETTSVSDTSQTPNATAVDSTAPGGASGSTEAVNVEQRGYRKLTVTELIDKVGSSVVFLTARNALGDPVATGSGFVIDTEGIIATNRHVVASAASVEVQFKDETKTEITGYLAVDQLNDLAILTVRDVPKSATALSLDRPELLRQGDELVAVGHPSSFKFTVTSGIVSAIRTTENLPGIYRDGLHTHPDTKWVQTNAAISGGSSGGPLFDNHGRLVGINTWIASGRSLGFAVDSSHLIELFESRSASTTSLPVPGSRTLATAKVQQILEDYLRDADRAEPPDEKGEDSLLQKTVKKLHQIATTSDVELERIEAISLAVNLGGTPSAECPGYIVDMLEKNTHLAVSPVADRIAVFSSPAMHINALDNFLEIILEKNPRQYARAQACVALASMRNMQNRGSQRSAEISQLLTMMGSQFKDFVSPQGGQFSKLAKDWFVTFNQIEPNYSRAMPLEGADIDGQDFKLSDFCQKYTLLTFFRDADPTCRAEYENLKKCRKFIESGDLVHLGVNSDEASRAKAVLSDGDRIPWRSWVDPESQITEKWQVQMLPTSYLIGKDGTVLVRLVGEVGHKNLVDIIEAQLALDEILPGDLVGWNNEWQYKAGPVEGWTNPDFDSSAWPSANGPLGYGQPTVKAEISDRGRPVCFRRQFTAKESTEALLFRVKFNDGITVFLDGKELFRRNAPADATQLALGRISPTMVHPQTICLDGSLVEPGKTHTLCAVVYPHAEDDADLMFRMSLTSGLPNFEEIAQHESLRRRMHAAALMTRSASQISNLPELITLFGKDKNANVRAMATATKLCALDLDKPVPNSGWAFRAETRRARAGVASSFNNQAWGRVMRAGDSQHTYEEGARMARAAYAMSTTKAGRSAKANTLGVGLLRLGRAKEALKLFEEADKLESSNINMACIGLAHHSMGQTDKAREMLEKVEEKLIETRDSYDDTVLMLNELRQLLADNPKEPAK